MGAWGYCRKCDCGLDKPTIREAFERAIHCVRCGARRDLDDEDQMYAIEEVVERIERLEGLVLSDKKEHPSVVIVPENPDVRRERLGRTFFAISALIPVKEGLEEGQTYSVHVKDGGTTVNFNGVRAVRNGFDWFLNLRSASSYSIQPSMEIEFV